ncbi:hypothetical protein OIU85_011898 [Salix viminalis]|uniref:Uncharacterized protein n=1 Tax=Salix viminalis TaxID=40686 RepID=A0A9Q0NTU4_SALVM|nr:hypothetical protein OIU85_011898 [Salix viminalis]
MHLSLSQLLPSSKFEDQIRAVASYKSVSDFKITVVLAYRLKDLLKALINLLVPDTWHLFQDHFSLSESVPLWFVDLTSNDSVLCAVYDNGDRVILFSVLQLGPTWGSHSTLTVVVLGVPINGTICQRDNMWTLSWPEVCEMVFQSEESKSAREKFYLAQEARITRPGGCGGGEAWWLWWW